jgi:hypothetical protein
MSKLSRRSLVSAAALPALAVPAVAVAASESDPVRRNLWCEYLVHEAAYEAAQEKYVPTRAAFNAELPPCPDDVLPGHHWKAHQWLWNKYGLDALRDALCDADNRMGAIVEEILKAEANSLFGIGVKLAALPSGDCLHESHHDPQGYVDAAASVLSDINRLLGTDFVSTQNEDEWEEEQEEEEA